ncbi:MAG: hypothetical protein CFE21_03090 [Bacteroidetes bacterium B1(2017)]|nr:MAG: hypothetical protein CFE21_03090 [Bacteroidetes bacterium B1(2017)]
MINMHKLIVTFGFLCLFASPALAQTDTGLVARAEIKSEMEDMRNKIDAYLKENNSTDMASAAKELNKKWNTKFDSLVAITSTQQAEIAVLKQRLSALENAKVAKPEVVTTKFDKVLAVVYFEVGSYKLSPENKAIIQKVVAEHGSSVLQLVAYTDWVGNDEFNQQLSNERANSVQSELLSSGFLITNLRTYARGKAAKETEKLSAAECRRVEIRE